jgi:hypothetical protein
MDVVIQGGDGAGRLARTGPVARPQLARFGRFYSLGSGEGGGARGQSRRELEPKNRRCGELSSIHTF